MRKNTLNTPTRFSLHRIVFVVISLFTGIIPLVMTSEAYASRVLHGADPWYPNNTDASYLGTKFTRPWLGDLQPSVLWDGDPSAPFKMWWLCHYSEDLGPDLGPTTGPHPADRICHSSSVEPSAAWTPPVVVLKGLFTSTADHRGDNNLVGSPSVLKLNCWEILCPTGYGNNDQIFVMFYEAMDLPLTRVNRFFAPSRADNFVTGGEPSPTLSDLLPDYQFERHLGYVPAYEHADTVPVYSCEQIYSDGKINRYLSTDACPVGRTLNGGSPVFWTWLEAGEHRYPLYDCYMLDFRNNFVTEDPGCEGLPRTVQIAELGYVSKGFDGDTPVGDMIGANQNRIHMAYSRDGQDWTRFDGNAEDGTWAVVLPGDQSAMAPQTKLPGSNLYSADCTDDQEMYNFSQTYGAGYPSALIRDGYLELFFYDDTDPTDPDEGLCGKTSSYKQHRIRIAESTIFDADRWVDASTWSNRGHEANYGSDIKWSPKMNRYFATTFKVDAGDQVPVLVWSDENPPSTGPLTINYNLPEHTFDATYRENYLLPTYWDDSTNQRIGANGAILSDGKGHVLYNPGRFTDRYYGGPGFYPIHIFYEAYEPGKQSSPHHSDIDHILIFGWESFTGVMGL